MWVAQHLESSSSLPDILRVNHGDGHCVVIAELFQGIKEWSALQTQVASDRYVVPNPCCTRLSVKIPAPLYGGVMGGCSLEEIIRSWIC